jgi:4-amino-4-deoxy-L-arabinose transferase-like glycosyltransferase
MWHKLRLLIHISTYEQTIIWIVLLGGVVYRLYMIDQPFVDMYSWRQSDYAMIAHNYFTGESNFFYPKINHCCFDKAHETVIDWENPMSGVVGTELPLLPYSASLLYAVLGEKEIIGRALSVLWWLLSVPFYFLLIRRIFSDRVARLALAFYAFAPLGVFSSRSFMPDTPYLSLSIIGLFYYWWWDEKKSHLALLLSGCAIALAILIKISALIIGLPLLYISFVSQRWQLFKDWKLWLFAIACLAPSALWYSHALLITRSYPPYHFFGEGGMGLAPPVGPDSYLGIMQRTFFWVGGFSSLTPLLSLLMIIGLVYADHKKYALLFHWWLLALGIFTFFVGKGSAHDWYQLPIIPIASFFAGKGLYRVLRSVEAFSNKESQARLILCMTLLIFVGMSMHSNIARYLPWDEPVRSAGTVIGNISQASDLLLVPTAGDPTIFYYSHRKGWHLWSEKTPQLVIDQIEHRRREGADLLVFTRDYGWWLSYFHELSHYLNLHFEKVVSQPDLVIFRISTGDYSTTIP